MDEYENDEIINSESDDELDEETRELMFNKQLKNIDDVYNIKERIINTDLQKKNNNVSNKKLSLSDFNKQVTKQEPTRFISKRVHDKKKELGLINEPTRQFNPRLQPYNLVHRKREFNTTSLDLNNHNLFPSL